MMAYDGESLIATAIERLNENMIRMSDSQQKYQEKTDAKLDRLTEAFSKLVAIDTEVKEGNKRVHHRIDENEKRLDKLEHARQNGGCPALKEHLAHIDGLNLEERVKVIEAKGTKRWETFVGELIKFTVVIVAGLVALKLGVKV